MTFEKCQLSIKQFAKQNGLNWTQERIDAMTREVMDNFDKMSREQLREHLSNVFVNSVERSAIEQKNARLSSLRKFAQDAQNLAVKRNGRTVSRNLIDLIEGGSTAAGDGLNRSSEGHAYTFESMALEAFHGGLPDDIEKIAITGVLDTDIHRSMAILQTGEKLTPEVAKAKNLSGTAVKVAQAAHDALEFLFEAKRAFAPHLEKASDYIIKRIWDSGKMLSAGQSVAESRAKFSADMLENFGERSFPGSSTEKKIELFGEMFDMITTGRFFESDFVGDKAARLARERKIFANSPEAFAAMAKKYGYGNFMEAFVRNLKQTSRDLGVMQKFGARPDLYLEKAKQFLAANAPEERDLFNSPDYKNRLEAAFYRATHLGDSVAQTLHGKTGELIRQVGWITAGGNTAIRAITDHGSAGAILSTLNNSRTAIGSTVRILARTIGMIADKKTRESVLKKTMLFSHAGMNALADNFGYEARVVGPGKMDKVLYAGSWLGQKMSKWSGLVLINDSMRAGDAAVHSNSFAELLDAGWKDLPNAQRIEYSRYNIGEAEFDVFSKAVSTIPDTDIRVVDKAKLMALPAEELLAYAKKAKILSDDPNFIRFELIGRLGTMYNDLANIATSTPGVAEKTIMYGKTGADGWGAFRRILWHFRGSALTNMRTYARVAASGQGLVGKMGALSSMAAANVVLYTLGDVAIQYMNGKTPQDVTGPYLAKIAGGAGLGGIGGDAIIGTIFSENPSAGNLLMQAAGYGPSSIARPIEALAKWGQAAYEGKPLGRYNERVANALVLRNMPIVTTIPVVSGVWNLHINGSIREWLHSTAMIEEEARMREKGQEYWVK